MINKNTKTPNQATNVTKKARVTQEDVPSTTLEAALKVAQALFDNFGNQGAEPHQLAIALDVSPRSSSWRTLSAAAAAYGLTKGAAQSVEISLTSLGKQIAAPEDDGDRERGLLIAAVRPRILKEFYQRYDKSKFPKDNIAKNVLESMGVPKDRVDNVYNLVVENGKYSGLIQDLKTGWFVYLNSLNSNNFRQLDEEENESNGKFESGDQVPSHQNTIDFNSESTNIEPSKRKQRVFISHGKNQKVVGQLKEILTFGQFDVIVSVEKESTAIPVPEKVFSDMRGCDAAVIHVESELELLDKEGNVHTTINQNVLIEIGAAIALYGKQFVLLCESSLKLPSNLQGLYRCNYDGAELNYEATMKLLKAFNSFRGSDQGVLVAAASA